jgi:hypothetical protein
MAFSSEIYQALETVVGTRNISADPGVLETYRCAAAQSSAHYGPYDHKTPRPQAVLLPGSTEEVQNIIRICNKYNIQFKASSTFWSAMGYIGADNAIQLDMRRMRRVEIDAKNMLAVVEPYAIAAVVQAEAMKVGLNLNIPGVGCSSSTLASTAGWVGFGPTSISMGCASENMLGAEWVLPGGEVLRTGSLGAGSGWFCGEGPGPSSRAILRGFQGSSGSLGVCTRVAVRLHPWPGPTFIPTRGTIPAYKATLPDNFKCYTLCFPTWDKYADGITLLHENDLVYLGHRQFNMFGRNLKTAMLAILTDPDKQLCDLPELLEDAAIQKTNAEMKIEIQVIIAGMTPNDFAYKEKALDQILERCEGWKSAYMMDPEMADFALLYLIRMGHKNLNFVMCGAYEGNFGLSSNTFVSAPLLEVAAALKRRWELETPYIAATGGDSDMGSLAIIGGGGPTGWEFFTHFDAYDKESIQGTAAYFNDTQRWMHEKGLGVDMGHWNQDVRKEDGYHFSQEEYDAMYLKMAQPLVAAYQYKIREIINPKNLCGGYYRTLNPEKLNQRQ